MDWENCLLHYEVRRSRAGRASRIHCGGTTSVGIEVDDTVLSRAEATHAGLIEVQGCRAHLVGDQESSHRARYAHTCEAEAALAVTCGLAVLGQHAAAK